MTDKEKRTALNEAFSDRFLVEKTPSRYYGFLVDLGFTKIENASETWDLIGKANEDLLRELNRRGIGSSEKGEKIKRGIKDIVKTDPKTIPEFVKNRAKQIKVLQYFETLPDNFKF